MSQPGPLAEEAAKFLGAAQEWLHRTVLDPSTAKVATGSPECCWCPICQLVATVRGERPELAERLTELTVALAPVLSGLQAAVAGLLRTGQSPGGEHPTGEDPTGEHPTGDDNRERRTVQRIDLGQEG